MTNRQESTESRMLICDLRRVWIRQPYITFWRAQNAGYAYPLPWAGDYTEEEVVQGGSYYTTFKGRARVRFPIERRIVEAMAVAPKPGHIDGDVGPVVLNTAANRAKLRRMAFTTEPTP